MANLILEFKKVFLIFLQLIVSSSVHIIIIQRDFKTQGSHQIDLLNSVDQFDNQIFSSLIKLKKKKEKGKK